MMAPTDYAYNGLTSLTAATGSPERVAGQCLWTWVAPGPGVPLLDRMELDGVTWYLIPTPTVVLGAGTTFEIGPGEMTGRERYLAARGLPWKVPEPLQDYQPEWTRPTACFLRATDEERWENYRRIAQQELDEEFPT